MNRTEPSPGKVVAYHVTIRHKPGPPGVTGTWTDAAIAERKFTGFVGRYGGGADGVRIELLAETAEGELRVLQAWPPEPGAQR
ncbi:hypothetical protein ABZ605_27760 [Streptomyces sp. NPDC012765]|uniref:hypothetical protein n=1 Tax=Streptomyces sp. NPDC012765 TaxID=3155249 RepID=UPI0033F62172